MLNQWPKCIAKILCSKTSKVIARIASRNKEAMNINQGLDYIETKKQQKISRTRDTSREEFLYLETPYQYDWSDFKEERNGCTNIDITTCFTRIKRMVEEYYGHLQGSKSDKWTFFEKYKKKISWWNWLWPNALNWLYKVSMNSSKHKENLSIIEAALQKIKEVIKLLISWLTILLRKTKDMRINENYWVVLLSSNNRHKNKMSFIIR